MPSHGNNRVPHRWFPFSVTLWGRIWRDYWYLTIICGATLAGFHWLVVSFLPMYDMRYRLTYLRHLPDIMKGMIGQDIFDITSHTSITAFAYLHPVSLAILVAFALMVPSWMLVGQIDRGTIELFLATPLSRRKILFTTTLAGVVGGALLTGTMLLGTWIGLHRVKLSDPVDFYRIFIVAGNMYALYLLMLAVSIFFSCVTSLRGMAVGWSMGLAIAAYMIHFLSEWWKIIGQISFIGPLYYFRPIKIATGSYNPSKDIAVLLLAAAVLMVISTIWFSRRDIAVV